MYYKCHEINFKCDSSHIDFPDWLKKKKVKINPKNNDGICFQYAATTAIDYEKIENTFKEQQNFIRLLINIISME